MAAPATLVPNFGQNISSKSDLVPDWTGQEVSTGVSACFWPVRSTLGPVLILWGV